MDMSDNSKSKSNARKPQIKKEHTKDQTKLKFSGEKPGTKPPAKRFQPDYSNSTASDTSSGNISVLTNTTMDDFNNIQVQLEAMTNTISDLRGDLKSMLKRDETEDLIKSIMVSLEQKMTENGSK